MQCEYLEVGIVCFPIYEDERFYRCNKHKVDITPQFLPLVCEECQGQWSREQIIDYVYGKDTEDDY